MEIIEDKVKIMVLKKIEKREKEKFLDTAKKIHEIDENIPEIQKAA